MLKLAGWFIVLALAADCATVQRSASSFKFAAPDKTEIHPVLHNTSWLISNEIREYFTDRRGSQVLWRRSIYYKHPTEPWFMGSYEIFGRSVLRAYGVRNQNGLYILKHYLMLRRDKDWILAESETIEFIPIKNTEQEIVGVKLVLWDKDGIIATKIVPR